jgi:type I restriction enzyme, S subunit
MTAPFPIPAAWVWTTLGEIAEVVGGVTKDTKKQSDPALPEVPYLRVANVQRGYLDLGEITKIRVPESTLAKLRLLPGDVLLNEGGDRDKLGRGWVWEDQISDCIHQNHVFRARLPEDTILPRFLAYYINDLARQWFDQHAAQSVNLASISLSTIKQLPVPLPPLDEQRRIVATLEDHLSRASLGDQNLRQVRLRSSALRRSLLDAAVSGRLVPRGSSNAKEWLSGVVSMRLAFSKRNKPPVLPTSIPGYELPNGWTMTSLDAIASNFGYGTSTRCDFGAAGDPVLRIPNIQRGEIILDNLKNAVDSSIDLSSLHVDHGDVLFIRTNGSRDLIGRAGVVRKSLQIAYASYLIRFRLIPNGIPADWVLLVVSSPLWRAYLENQASSSAGQYNLNSRILAQLPVPVPPPDQISLILSQVDGYEDIQRAFDSECTDGEKRSKLLRKSLLTEAFSGRLVSQDPGDEPGLMLLERIRAELAAQPRARRGRGMARHVSQEETLL